MVTMFTVRAHQLVIQSPDHTPHRLQAHPCSPLSRALGPQQKNRPRMKQLSFGALGGGTPRSEEPVERKGQAAGVPGCGQCLCGTPSLGRQDVQLVLDLGGIFLLPPLLGF